jgi:uncharacterized protein YrrD
MRLEPGRAVRCADADYGELADVVIDPTARRVTHLVVQPRHRHAEARLVPTELIADDNGGAALALRCSTAELDALPHVQELAFLRLDEFPVQDPEWDVGITTVLALPYYEPVGIDSALPYDDQVEMSYDRVPKGAVEIQRGSRVDDADHRRLGDVDGFVVDADGQITHLVLERGHLWGRRDVTIPIGAVAGVANDVVTLAIGEDEVAALPSVRVHRWGR